MADNDNNTVVQNDETGAAAEEQQITDIDALVIAAAKGEVSSFKDMFDELMAARAADALNTRKMEVASSMFQDDDAPVDDVTGEDETQVTQDTDENEDDQNAA